MRARIANEDVMSYGDQLFIDQLIADITAHSLTVPEALSAAYDAGYEEADGLRQDETDDGHNDGYDNGFADGRVVGYDGGFADGLADADDYSDGYTEGYNIGWNEGFAEGVSA